MKVVTEWQLNGKRGLLIQHLLGKKQLLLQLYEWYMHPNGQLPAYEWAFGDVNPPVHAWAAWHIYKQEKELTGKGDTFFLERVFQKLLLNSSARSHGVRSRPDVVAPQSLPAPAGWLAAPPSTLYTADIEPLVGPVAPRGRTSTATKRDRCNTVWFRRRTRSQPSASRCLLRCISHAAPVGESLGGEMLCLQLS